jgi:hypothetical protein
MSAKPASPAKRPNPKLGRGLLKIASLGIAGLIAGLLSGCNITPDASSFTLNSHNITEGYLISGHPTRQ